MTEAGFDAFFYRCGFIGIIFFLRNTFPRQTLRIMNRPSALSAESRRAGSQFSMMLEVWIGADKIRSINYLP
jgi:hypothetical protein